MPPKAQKRTFRHLAILGLGWLFVVLGVIGLFLPLLQGILFLMIGVTILSTVSSRARLFRQQIGQRFPNFRRRAHDARVWIRDVRRRLSSRR